MLSSFAHDAEHVVEMDDVPPRGAYALPPPPAVPRGALERMEAQLREAIFTRSTSIASEQRVLRAAFRAIDLDGSGNIDFGEFQAALERFGLHVAASGLKGVGGISQDIAKCTRRRRSLGLLGRRRLGREEHGQERAPAEA